MSALIPLFLQLGGMFITNKDLLTTIGSGVQLGVDLFDMGKALIDGSPDAPADQLAEANALVLQLQAVRDQKEELLAKVAPNS